MNIERIYIACHRRDLRLTRICVASIRAWYPEIPIYLIKDQVNGPFCTRELEKYWGVTEWSCDAQRFGWGFAKLEPLFDTTRRRFLVLDSDIAFVGPVLEKLAQSSADFVVHDEQQPPEAVRSIYFDLDRIGHVDATFRTPAFTFNTGQIVATSGVLARSDFEAVIEWTEPRRLRHPDIFKNGDQGIMNYVLLCKLVAGEVSVDRVPFMLWGLEQTASVSLPDPLRRSSHRDLIHWAGMKKPRINSMMRGDILLYFEKQYYRRVRWGQPRRLMRAIDDYCYSIWWRLRYRFRRAQQWRQIVKAW